MLAQPRRRRPLALMAAPYHAIRNSWRSSQRLDPGGAFTPAP
jgi:hypothetical protein